MCSQAIDTAQSGHLRFGAHPSLRVAKDSAVSLAMNVISVGENVIVFGDDLRGKRRVLNGGWNRRNVRR